MVKEDLVSPADTEFGQPRIRVLSVITNLGLGGGENRLLAFAQTLDTERFEHTVVTLNAPDAEHERQTGSLRAAFVAANVELLDLGIRMRPQGSNPWRPDHWLRKLSLLCVVVWRLRRILRERRVDVLDAHLRDASIISALAKPFTGVRAFSTQYHRWEGRLPNLLGPLILRRFDRLITDSAERAQELKDWSAMASLPAVIVNGVALPRSSTPPAAVRQQLRLPAEGFAGDGPIIGQIGRLVAFKGQMTLLHAAAEVLKQYPGAMFLLVGFPPKFSEFQRELEASAEALGIADRVRIGGYGGAVGDVWQLLDIHVHASHFDSLPNAILEGMALARPAVVTDVGGVASMVHNEQTGLVVAPGDADELAAGILRLLDDPAYAQRLGQAAYQRYQQHCTAEAISRRLEALFAAEFTFSPAAPAPHAAVAAIK